MQNVKSIFWSSSIGNGMKNQVLRAKTMWEKCLAQIQPHKSVLVEVRLYGNISFVNVLLL